MTKKELLINEIDTFPENLIDEVIDFVQFLKMKKIIPNVNLEKKENLEITPPNRSPVLVPEITMASESSLKKDWLSEEEEQAWQSL